MSAKLSHTSSSSSPYSIPGIISSIKNFKKKCSDPPECYLTLADGSFRIPFIRRSNSYGHNLPLYFFPENLLRVSLLLLFYIHSYIQNMLPSSKTLILICYLLFISIYFICYLLVPKEQIKTLTISFKKNDLCYLREIKPIVSHKDTSQNIASTVEVRCSIYQGHAAKLSLLARASNQNDLSFIY